MSEIIKKAATNEVVELLYNDLRNRANNKAPVIFNNAVGNPVVFSDGADGLPIQSLKVNLLPRQEGSGDPSPENIRSIIPWNGVDVFGGGKNLVGCTIGTTRSVNGIDYVVLSDGGVNCEGTANGSSYGIESKKITLPSGMYTFSVTGATNAHTVIVKNNAYYREISGVGSTTFTLTEETVIHFYIMFSSGAVANETVYVQLEAGQIATVYEPFVPITDTDIVFPSPIYGGIPDAIRGKMMVTWGVETFDGSSDEVWYFVQAGSTSWYRAYIVMTDAKQPNDVSCFADSYKAVSFNDRSYASKVCMFGNENESPIIFNVVTEIETFDAFKAYLAENPLTIAYKLAEPYEVDIDASVLTSLYGNNTIWSDANGDIEVEYRADTELFLKQNTVKDVQINGSSVLNDGVANIPKAGDSTLGVVKGRYYGVRINADGDMYISTASESEVKAGSSNYLPIVPSNQHKSVFYALAKLAGADMASSSNPVGTYTDAAKVAIQKMLGVYEAPWELIREDTVTNATEADVEITVDGDGDSFELTDVYLQVWTPQQETVASIGDYGTVRNYYYGDSGFITSQMQTWEQASGASAKYGQVLLKNENGAIINVVTLNNSQYDLVNLAGRTNMIANDALVKIGTYSFKKTVIKKVTGTLNYRLYGRRKWN